jgi:hypothetical protein
MISGKADRTHPNASIGMPEDAPDIPKEGRRACERDKYASDGGRYAHVEDTTAII